VGHVRGREAADLNPRREATAEQLAAGRGLGESIFSLPNGGAIRLATARYANANGDTYGDRVSH